MRVPQFHCFLEKKLKGLMADWKGEHVNAIHNTGLDVCIGTIAITGA